MTGLGNAPGFWLGTVRTFSKICRRNKRRTDDWHVRRPQLHFSSLFLRLFAGNFVSFSSIQFFEHRVIVGLKLLDGGLIVLRCSYGRRI